VISFYVLGVPRPQGSKRAFIAGGRFVRPKSHTTPKGKLRLSAPQNHTQRPDLDKLTRCVLDGLTQAGVMHDDSQVTQLSVAKMWGEIAGCTVEIRKAGA